jgi:imidazolonepropionase-like amidohydrolase
MRTILTAPRLIDGITATPVRDAVVVIEDDRIARLGPAAEVRVEPVAGVDTVIDVPDGTILPGFIEMHTHMHCSASAQALEDVLTDSDGMALLRAATNLRAMLGAGVTTMRDIGSKNIVAFTVRESVRRGIIAGPRVLVSGAPITTTGGHFYFMGLEADTVEEVIEAFRAQVKAGADHVKIMVSGGGFTPGTNMRRSQYPPEHVQAAAFEARRLHKHLVAHCHATEAIRYAAESGAGTIVHCSWMTEDGMRVDERAIELMLENGIYVDPTIAVGFRPLEQALAANGPLSPPLQARLEDRKARMEVFRGMWDRGVRFIVGTDSGMNHTSFSDWALTPERMVLDLGLSPFEAIQAGTKVAAEALGMAEEIGTLAPGRLADVTVVRGDPLARISALYDVDTVLLAGRVAKRDGALVV